MMLLSTLSLSAEDFTSNTTVTENVDDGMVVFGGVTVTVAANIFVGGGTIDIKPGGTLLILSSATLSTDQDVVNDNGTITINGAIDTNGSKFENKAGGTVNGSGTIIYSNDTQMLNPDSSNFFGYTGGNPTGPDGPCSGGTCSDASLPISLLDFTARVIDQQVMLSWITGTETNNDFFTVERSGDGYNWQAILDIKGAGTSNAPLQYNGTDEKPVSGLNYYRLRQTDFDGSSTVSSIKAVEIKTELAAPVRIFPNPTVGQLTVIWEDSETIAPRFYTLQGKEVSSQISILHSGDQQYQLDLSNLPTGLYIFQTSGGSTKVYKQ